jgi:hypothetical protein
MDDPDLDSRIASIINALEAAGLTVEPTLIHDAAVGVAHELAQPDRFRAIHASLNEKHVSYAIRDSDLDLVREVGAVAAAIAAGLPSAASVIVGLLVFLVRYRRKRIRLDADQAVLLKLLSESRPASCSIEEIIARLAQSRRFSAEQVTSVLASLKSVVQVDGNVTALVGEDHGLWRAIDV